MTMVYHFITSDVIHNSLHFALKMVPENGILW